MGHLKRVYSLLGTLGVLALSGAFLSPHSTQGASLTGAEVSTSNSALQRSFDIFQECTPGTQLCDPPWTVALRTPQHITINYFVAEGNCSSIRLHVLVDGTEMYLTEWLGWLGGPPPLKTGNIRIGPLIPGVHVLGLRAEGRVGGCNTGELRSWGGTLMVRGGPDASTDSVAVIEKAR